MKAGTYVIKLENVQDHEGRYGPCLRLVFRIAEGEFKGYNVTAMSNTKYFPGSKLHKIIKSFGVELNLNEEIDLHSLIGERCVADVVESPVTNGMTVYYNATAFRRITNTKLVPEPEVVTRTQTRKFLRGVQ